MPKKISRIVIDTNIWISILITKDFTLFDKVISGDKFILLFSNKLLEEFVEVASRPKFKKYFSANDLEELLYQISANGEFIIVTSSTDICRDLKDNFLLSLSKDGKASYLITGDKDLLDLAKYRKTKIVTMKMFLSEL